MTDEKREKVIKGMKEAYQTYLVVEGQGILVDNNGNEYALIAPVLLRDALALLKAQEPRVMTFEEVKEKIGSGECVFTECEKENQWMRYGDARLSVDQGDSCRIAFLISRRGDNPYVRWWMIYYENYNKTWRCWTSRPTDEQRKAVKWE